MTESFDEQTLVEINRKLDTIIRLLISILIKDIPSEKEKIIFLSRLDMKNVEIAKILGKNRKAVDTALSRMRKSSSSKSKTSKT